MSETFTLPVLPLDEEVVLPGMVVPPGDLAAGGRRRDRRGADAVPAGSRRAF